MSDLMAVCETCGDSFERRSKRGRCPRWCPSCKQERQRRQWREAARRRREERLEYFRERYRENREEILAEQRRRYEEDDEFRRRKRRRARERAREDPEANVAKVQAWREENPERHRANNLRRKARIRGNGTEPYDRLDVFERDGWVCQLCDEPIDRDLEHPDPMSRSIDHIVPIVEGGPDTEDNVQAAHLVCNTRKGDRLEHEAA